MSHVISLQPAFRFTMHHELYGSDRCKACQGGSRQTMHFVCFFCLDLSHSFEPLCQLYRLEQLQSSASQPVLSLSCVKCTNVFSDRDIMELKKLSRRRRPPGWRKLRESELGGSVQNNPSRSRPRSLRRNHSKVLSCSTTQCAEKENRAMGNWTGAVRLQPIALLAQTERSIMVAMDREQRSYSRVLSIMSGQIS